jgi:exosortase A
VLAGIFVLILVLYRDTMQYLGGLWSRFQDGPYGHGFLVLAVGLYLLYLRRARILALIPCPDARGLAAIAASVLVWLAAVLADIQLVQAVVLLPLVLSVVWTVAGLRVAGQVLFPVMFLAFALPVWSPLLPILRALTAAGAFFLIRLSGITAHMQGYVVQLPAGQLSIEAACSGLNYLLAALTLGVFYAAQNYSGFRARLLVVMVAAGAALLANILRVVVIIYLAYSSDMQHPYVKHHLMLGWYLFGALVLVLLLVDHLLLHRRRGRVTGSVSDSVRDPGRPGCDTGLPVRVLLLSVLAVLIVSGPVAAWWLKQRVTTAPEPGLESPPGRAGWSGLASLNDSWQPVYHGASQLRSGYHKQGLGVQLFAGFYPRQRQGGELINDLNSISGPGWRQTGERRIVSSTGDSVMEVDLVSTDNQRRIVWYRYRVAGRYTTSGYVAKVLQVLGLLGGREDAAVIALAADVAGDAAGVREGLDDFMVTMGPVLDRLTEGKANEQGRDR